MNCLISNSVVVVRLTLSPPEGGRKGNTLDLLYNPKISINLLSQRGSRRGARQPPKGGEMLAKFERTSFVKPLVSN